MSKWNQRFLDLADHISTWSKDPSTKVGCVIVNPRNLVVSTGFNGFPSGVEDLPERYANRELKLQMVLHAEENALSFYRGSVEGCSLYVTHPTCSHCAGLIIQQGISKVVVPLEAWKTDMADRYKESNRIARIMYSEAGVEYVEM